MRLSRLASPVGLMLCACLAAAAVTGLEADAAPRGGQKWTKIKASAAPTASPTPTVAPSASAEPTPTTEPTVQPTVDPTPTLTASATPTRTETPLGATITERPFTMQRGGEQLRSSYCTNGTVDEPTTAATTVVIVIHGDSRTACDQARYVAESAADRGRLGQTLVVAPHFLTTEDAAAAEPGRLYWSDGGWKSGSQSLTSPYARAATASSYDVLDALVTQVTSADVTPNLERLVIAGHSAGGQVVNRYAATAHVDVTRANVSLRYVVANPSSYLYFDTRRPDGDGFRTLTASEVSACSSYNTYKYGLTKLYSYAQASTTPLPQRYAAARVDYLLGELDTDRNDSSLDTSCAANWQGADRYARGQAYFRYLGTALGDAVYERQSLAVVPGVGHSAHDMFTSSVGAQTLFP